MESKEVNDASEAIEYSRSRDARNRTIMERLHLPELFRVAVDRTEIEKL